MDGVLQRNEKNEAKKNKGSWFKAYSMQASQPMHNGIACGNIDYGFKWKLWKYTWVCIGNKLTFKTIQTYKTNPPSHIDSDMELFCMLRDRWQLYFLLYLLITNWCSVPVTTSSCRHCYQFSVCRCSACSLPAGIKMRRSGAPSQLSGNAVKKPRFVPPGTNLSSPVTELRPLTSKLSLSNALEKVNYF